MPPPTLEEVLACANADTDSNQFEGPIASNTSAYSPAHSDFTDGELEAFVDTLEVTTISAGDTRAPNSKPKPSGFAQNNYSKKLRRAGQKTL